jgi:hypothetical protein
MIGRASRYARVMTRRIAVLDGTGRELRTATIATSPTVLKPGESAAFHAELPGVAESAARLSITFAGE